MNQSEIDQPDGGEHVVRRRLGLLRRLGGPPRAGQRLALATAFTRRPARAAKRSCAMPERGGRCQEFVSHWLAWFAPTRSQRRSAGVPILVEGPGVEERTGHAQWGEPFVRRLRAAHQGRTLR